MNVLITGAAKGIGFELVKKFLDQRAHNIIAISRNIKPLEELKSYNTNIYTHKIDFLSQDFQDKIKECVNQYNFSIDIVINNAGMLMNKPFLDYTLKEITDIYQVNTYAPLQVIQSLIKKQPNQKCHIVNIGSMGGYQGSVKFSGLSLYSSTKASLSNITECLAEEYKNSNIKFNCLALGSVQTEMFSNAFSNHQAQLSPQEIADHIFNFAINGHKYYNGKILPVSKNTP